MTKASKTPVTLDDIKRVMSAVSRKHGGKVPKNSYVGQLQRQYDQSQTSDVRKVSALTTVKFSQPSGLTRKKGA